MKKIVLCLAAVAVVAGVDAQTFFPMKKGAALEYRYYDSKGKPIRDQWRNEHWTRLTVEEVWGDSIANVAIENETYARLADNESAQPVIEGVSYGDVMVKPGEVVFENVMWTFTWDMLYRTPTDKKEDEEDAGKQTFDVELNASASLPRELHVGDSLPEAVYKSTFYEKLDAKATAKREESNREREEYYAQFLEYGNFEIPKFPTNVTIEITAIIRNRRVEKMETVKTPAGDFECYRISYEIVGPLERRPGVPRGITGNSDGEITINYGENIVPPITKYVDYLSPEVGLVKREKLNFRGKKIEETMILTKINN